MKTQADHIYDTLWNLASQARCEEVVLSFHLRPASSSNPIIVEKLHPKFNISASELRNFLLTKCQNSSASTSME